MDIDLNDPLQALLGELRYHAQVYDRYRAVLPDTTIKGISLTAALAAVAKHGGTVEKSEIWALPGGGAYLAPWKPIQEQTA
jgi:hypothetical protein